MESEGVDLLGESAPDPVKPRRTRRAKHIVSEDQVAGAVVGFCNLIASFDRPWWAKQKDEVTPFSNPLTEYINELPPGIGKIVAEAMRPYALVMGAIVVFGPPVKAELELAKNNAKLNQVASGNRSRGFSSPFGTPNSQSQNPPNGTGGNPDIPITIRSVD